MITPEQIVNSEARVKFLKDWEDKIDHNLSVYGYIEISSSDYRHIKDLLNKYEENGFELVRLYTCEAAPDFSTYQRFNCFKLGIKQEKPVEPEQSKTSWWSRFF